MRIANSRGFSLIELMIVVVIIGILATIALPNYTSMVARSREGVVKQIGHAVQMAAEDYSVQNDARLPADASVFDGSMFPQGLMPTNPFTDAPITVGATGTYSMGNIGYTLDAATNKYVIEGYGETATSGEGGDGVVITLTNG